MSTAWGALDTTGGPGRPDVSGTSSGPDAREAFLRWFDTTWRAAEVALHGGDPEPRSRTWSETAPVTLFGAWTDATDPVAARAVFARLGERFSSATSSEIDLVAADVRGDLAYTVHREVTRATVDGVPRSYVLRVTQVYRLEADGWKVVHRHGDEAPGSGPSAP